ncbi:MAG: sigma 54-interacting transcriptional regulator [Clostridiales bacterium]|nr:sigma 54-interacting transcriptional regulator [Clostridiales bacterium]
MKNYNNAEQYGMNINDLLPILNSIGEAIFIDNAEGYALWINEAGEEIYRIKKEEIIGKHCSYLENMGIFEPSVARKVIEKKEVVTILHKNRDGKQLLSTGTPIFDEQGQLSKIVTSSHDITELVELQNKLESIQSALQDYRVSDGYTYEGIVANSPAMFGVIQMVERLASLDTTVLITGESGSGKGVIAKLLHEKGNRRDHPFIQINCGAIPANLLESELFGYDRGAFTGSRREGKKGLFEAAKNGTVFLDEISELPLNMQVKILQVIQEKAIQRVGGIESIPVDVRIISATNRDLEQMVREGRFREDLFYRLNVVPISIPALRDRPEDIVPMIRAFLEENNKKFNEKKTMNTAAMSILLKYRWPGNVRELENIIERLVITTKGNVIGLENLPGYISENARSPGEISISHRTSLQDTLDAVEKQILSDAQAKYKTTREIAKALAISQPTVVRKLAKHGL